MSVGHFYPYRTCPDQIALSLEPEGLPDAVRPDGPVYWYKLEVDRLAIRVAVVVPAEVLHRVIAPVELDSPPVDVRILYHSLISRQRGALSLEGDGCVHQGLLDIKTGDWRGELEVQAVLVRTRANPGLPPGYGADIGSMLAWSEPRRILFDEPVQPSGATLNIKWTLFAEIQGLKQYADHLFALWLQGDVPTLFLNEGVDRAKIVLESKARRGPIARIRDATHFLIIHQVWTSLLTSALRELADTVRDDEPGDLDDMPEGWRPVVLRQWARHLYPERGNNALDYMMERVASSGGLDELWSRIPAAIQAKFETCRGFSGLVGELG